MQAVANNIANMSTSGYRREGVIFSEHVSDLGADHASLSMAAARVKSTDYSQGALERTGGVFDLAVEGDGYFMVATPDGDRLTRAGQFVRSQTGELTTPDGNPLLDAGGAPVFAPPDAEQIFVAPDGTLSADGTAVAQIGLVRPVDPNALQRQAGVLFDAGGDVEPADDAQIRQGFLEGSNVSAIAEITRMIEVQRAYEMGQGFLEREDERIRTVMTTLGR